MIIRPIVPITRFALAIFVLGLVAISSTVSAQKIAILAPKHDSQTDAIAQELLNAFGSRAVDLAAADSAYLSVKLEDPFNLSTADGKRIGAVIGCSGFTIIKSETSRRTSSANPVYYESYLALFAVASRTGHLAFWKLIKAEDSSGDGSQRSLLESLRLQEQDLAKDIEEAISQDIPTVDNGFEEMPEAGSTGAKNFRPPIPYLRIKPKYTSLAYLYDAKGTVEIQVDLDDKGAVIGTEIRRWVGFGLEDSVTQAVIKMNWRPGERNGKPLPTRFLLRYNFKKIDKE